MKPRSSRRVGGARPLPLRRRAAGGPGPAPRPAPWLPTPAPGSPPPVQGLRRSWSRRRAGGLARQWRPRPGRGGAAGLRDGGGPSEPRRVPGAHGGRPSLSAVQQHFGYACGWTHALSFCLSFLFALQWTIVTMFSTNVTTYHHLISQAGWNRCNLSIYLSILPQFYVHMMIHKACII